MFASFISLLHCFKILRFVRIVNILFSWLQTFTSIFWNRLLKFILQILFCRHCMIFVDIDGALSRAASLPIHVNKVVLSTLAYEIPLAIFFSFDERVFFYSVGLFYVHKLNHPLVESWKFCDRRRWIALSRHVCVLFCSVCVFLNFWIKQYDYQAAMFEQKREDDRFLFSSRIGICFHMLHSFELNNATVEKSSIMRSFQRTEKLSEFWFVI